MIDHFFESKNPIDDGYRRRTSENIYFQKIPSWKILELIHSIQKYVTKSFRIHPCKPILTFSVRHKIRFDVKTKSSQWNVELIFIESLNSFIRSTLNTLTGKCIILPLTIAKWKLERIRLCLSIKYLLYTFEGYSVLISCGLRQNLKRGSMVVM